MPAGSWGTALRLLPGDADIERRQKQLRELRITVIKDREKGDIYSRFWKSGSYEKARADLRRREKKVEAKAIDAYLDLARSARSASSASRASGDGGDDLVDAAYRAAFEGPEQPRRRQACRC